MQSANAWTPRHIHIHTSIHDLIHTQAQKFNSEIKNRCNGIRKVRHYRQQSLRGAEDQDCNCVMPAAQNNCKQENADWRHRNILTNPIQLAQVLEEAPFKSREFNTPLESAGRVKQQSQRTTAHDTSGCRHPKKNVFRSKVFSKQSPPQHPHLQSHLHLVPSQDNSTLQKRWSLETETAD